MSWELYKVHVQLVYNRVRKHQHYKKIYVSQVFSFDVYCNSKSWYDKQTTWKNKSEPWLNFFFKFWRVRVFKNILLIMFRNQDLGFSLLLCLNNLKGAELKYTRSINIKQHALGSSQILQRYQTKTIFIFLKTFLEKS